MENKLIIKKALRSLRERGAYRTGWLLIDIILDRYFDSYFQINTAPRALLSDMDVIGDNRWHAVDYEATYPLSFIIMLRRLKFPKTFVFVDVGCGKGRVLILSAWYGFKQTFGLEFSRQLCDIAIINKAGFKRGRYNSRITIVSTDVLDYQMKDNENIFYLFNPFDQAILSQFIQKVTSSYKRVARPIFLIFHNMPCSNALLADSEIFFKYARLVYGSICFTVYSTAIVFSERYH